MAEGGGDGSPPHGWQQPGSKTPEHTVFHLPFEGQCWPQGEQGERSHLIGNLGDVCIPSGRTGQTPSSEALPAFTSLAYRPQPARPPESI